METQKLLFYIRFHQERIANKTKLMNKQYLLFLIFFLSLLMTNCGKDNLNGASGQIINAATEEGVPNAQVILYEAETSILGPALVTFLEQVTTDEEGFYIFDSDIQRNETYKVSVEADTYFESNLNSFPSNKIIEMTPETIVQLHLKNIPPTHYLDKISTGGTFEIGGGGPYFGEIDTVVSGIVRGFRDISIVWFTSIAGEPSVSNNTVAFAKGHDTIYYEILY